MKGGSRLIHLILAEPSAGGPSCSGEAVSRTHWLMLTAQPASGEWFQLAVTGVRHGQPSEVLALWQIVERFCSQTRTCEFKYPVRAVGVALFLWQKFIERIISYGCSKRRLCCWDLESLFHFCCCMMRHFGEKFRWCIILLFKTQNLIQRNKYTQYEMDQINTWPRATPGHLNQMN